MVNARTIETPVEAVGRAQELVNYLNKDQEFVQRIGRLESVEYLATGGFGQIFRAYFTATNKDGRKVRRSVVLKLPLLGNSNFLQISFNRELHTLQALRKSKIENVPTFINGQEDTSDQTGFIVMSDNGQINMQYLIEGTANIAPEKVLTFRNKIEVMRTVAKTLTQSSSEGLTHGDIKMSNIFMKLTKGENGKANYIGTMGDWGEPMIDKEAVPGWDEASYQFSSFSPLLAPLPFEDEGMRAEDVNHTDKLRYAVRMYGSMIFLSLILRHPYNFVDSAVGNQQAMQQKVNMHNFFTNFASRGMDDDYQAKLTDLESIDNDYNAYMMSLRGKDLDDAVLPLFPNANMIKVRAWMNKALSNTDNYLYQRNDNGTVYVNFEEICKEFTDALGAPKYP